MIEISRVAGWCGDADYFTFLESREFQPEQVLDVLKGKVAGVIFRGIASSDTCAALTDRFWRSTALKERGSEEPNYYLGAYHYHKTTAQYLDESAAVANALADVLDVPDSPLTQFREGLSRRLAPDVVFRPARHEGRDACQALLRSWRGQGQFALQPHEDLAQCGEPRQADFEIQQARKYCVSALNICLENGKGGNLCYWNVQPNEASKRRMGLQYAGWPYPEESLAGFEKMVVEIHPGDVYVFNGAHVHAVEPNAEAGVRRTTMSGLLSFIDDNTVVFWT